MQAPNQQQIPDGVNGNGVIDPPEGVGENNSPPQDVVESYTNLPLTHHTQLREEHHEA